MTKTPDYAVEIHAKVLLTRFRKHAVDEAEKHAKKLKQSGDNEGYEVWMLVASKIEQLKEKKLKK
jgi:hypothetical protein